jgi:ppGpp synthetase/RelA/SpoT-type nucleotidyltranferase
MKGNKQDWLKDQVDRYKSVFNKYEEYRGILEKILNTLADKYAPLGFVQTRTKSIPSFADKILRKNTPRRDPVNEFTDLCGARIVATTHAEVNAICEFIEDFFTIDWENSIDVSQRYKPEEFGYRSVHYIVSLKNSGSFPLDKEIKIPRDLMPKKNRPMKAEIQVRTLLEHAWAVFTHDRIYKSNFKIPDKWLRELAAVAAVLEESDRSFERIRSGIHAYASNYRAYMSKDQILEEIERLENVLFCDPDNAEITARLSELANSIGHWDKTIDLLSPLNKTNNQTLLKNLAVALIKKNNHRPKSREYKKGQAYLEKAAALAPADAECFASLGGSWKGLDEQKSQEYSRLIPQIHMPWKTTSPVRSCRKKSALISPSCHR